MERFATPIVDPLASTWGFHFHLETDVDDQYGSGAQMAHAILVQRRLEQILRGLGAPVRLSASYRSGYGPHRDHPMCVIRVEKPVEDCGADEDPTQRVDFKRNARRIPKFMGVAAVFMVANNQAAYTARSGSVASYVHIIDEHEWLIPSNRLSAPEVMAQEQRQHLNPWWFSRFTRMNIDFFSNPPRDTAGNMIDTRVPTQQTEDERERLVQQLTARNENFHDDFTKIITPDGFRILSPVRRTPSERAHLLRVYLELLRFLKQHDRMPDFASFPRSAVQPDASWFIDFKFHGGISVARAEAQARGGGNTTADAAAAAEATSHAPFVAHWTPMENLDGAPTDTHEQLDYWQGIVGELEPVAWQLTDEINAAGAAEAARCSSNVSAAAAAAGGGAASAQNQQQQSQQEQEQNKQILHQAALDVCDRLGFAMCFLMRNRIGSEIHVVHIGFDDPAVEATLGQRHVFEGSGGYSFLKSTPLQLCGQTLFWKMDQ